MPSVDLRFKILDDPDRRLAALKRGMRNRILRKAVRAGAKPVRLAFKRGAPKGETGALGASMSVRIGVSKRSGAVYAVIGPRRRYVRKKRGRVLSRGAPTKIAHLIEGGVRPHSIRKGDTLGRVRGPGKRRTAHRQTGGLHPGHKPNPFMRRGWNSTARQAADAMRAVIVQELARFDTAGGAADAG